MTRIREQIDKVADLKASCELELSADPVTLPGVDCADPLEQQVQSVAERVTEMVQLARQTEQSTAQGNGGIRRCLKP
jgi:hypothetical protein